MFCSQCGKQVSDNTNFCQYCGTPIVRTIPHPTPDIQPIQPIESTTLPPDEQPTEPATSITDTAEQISSAPPEKDGKKGLAIIGLVASCVGLAVSVILCFYGGMMLGIPLCIAGIILSSISLKGISSKAIAITGLVISIVGVIIGVLMMICFFAAMEGNFEFAYYFEEFMEEFFNY